jgi:hypothetical protein
MGRLLAAAALLLAGAAACAAEVDDLTVARAFVTGQGEVNRTAAFASALAEVLVKVSGDPRLFGDPRVAALAAQAGGMVAGFRYRDRLEGIPNHDEQGTRDRPYELTVTFDRARIDAALRGLGRTPWGATRPRVAVVVVLRTAALTAVLASDGTRGRDQRDSLLEAAQRRGVPVVLPNEAVAAGFGGVTDPDRLAVAARALGGEATLVGSLAWSDAALGWVATWRLDSGGRSHRWQVGGVTFDDAFRNAMGGAAQILSGNGEPQ